MTLSDQDTKKLLNVLVEYGSLEKGMAKQLAHKVIELIEAKRWIPCEFGEAYSDEEHFCYAWVREQWHKCPLPQPPEQSK